MRGIPAPHAHLMSSNVRVIIRIDITSVGGVAGFPNGYTKTVSLKRVAISDIITQSEKLCKFPIEPLASAAMAISFRG